jgi:hypothetical protein
MTDTTYSGWTNYATWRVNLELFDGYETDGQPVDHDSIKDMAEEIVLGEADEQSLAHSYAYAFLCEVNWYEIAESINKQIEQEQS